MKGAMPEAGCFSERNVYYISRFYRIYSPILPQLGAKSSGQISPRLAEILFSIPWGHHLFAETAYRLGMLEMFIKATLAKVNSIVPTIKGYGRDFPSLAFSIATGNGVKPGLIFDKTGGCVAFYC